MSNVVQLPIQPNALKLLQSCFAVLRIAGEYSLVDLQEVNDIQRGARRGELSLYKGTDANLCLRRHLETIAFPGDPKLVIRDFWNDPGTHIYNATAFDPRPTPADTLNLWTPSPVVPAQGSAKVIGAFLRDRICRGNITCLNYLLHYLAHMLMRPEEKPGVVIVMLGGQGTGKGSLFTLLHAIWPWTTLEVSDVEHVTGGFNAALAGSYGVCLDEAIFTGDRRAIDRMKSLVTERHITIEAKYQPRRTIESFHRFFAASNHAHFAKVDPDDRRFLFLRVASAMSGDDAYFKTLHDALANPTVIAAFVADLLTLNLASFNVRQRPKTAEHAAQKLRSLDGFDRYWHEVLDSGSLDPTGSPVSWAGPFFVETAALRSNCEAFNKSVRHHYALTDQDIGHAVAKWCPSAKRDRRKIQGVQLRGYTLPSLATARREFEAGIGSSIDWRDGSSTGLPK